jgi:hypothetical protein
VMKVASAKNLLSVVRAQTDRIGVAFSAGKDSLAVLDLVCEAFSFVSAFYLYQVPGLTPIETEILRAEKRYGIKVVRYPHFDLYRCFRHAVLQPHWSGLDRVPKIGFTEIEDAFREDTGVEWIAYGWRRNDSPSGNVA